MNFIQTGFLIGGAALAIPVLVHLLSRWQVQRVELGTMRFLQEVMQDGAQRRKIRRWLLLLTRLACVAALVLLFARPYLPEFIRRDGDRLRVILVDQSASMAMPGENGRLIDDAISQASELAGQLGTDAKIRWAYFDSRVHPIEPASNRISAPRSLVGSTNYLSALSWARDQVDAHPDAIADIVLISDFQQTGIASDSAETDILAMPKDLPVRLVDVGRVAASNIAVTSAMPQAIRTAPSQPAVVNVTLFNYGTLPLEEIPMTGTAENGGRSVRLKKSINIPGEQAQELAFDFGQLDPGIWQVTFQLDVEDDLAIDNHRITAMEVGQPASVMVIDGGSRDEAVLGESFYLTAALRQSKTASIATDDLVQSTENTTSRFDPKVVYLYDESIPDLQPDKFPLVVVADSASIPRNAVSRIESYVQAGGQLLVFAGDGIEQRDQTDNIWEGSALTPGRFGQTRQSGVMPFHLINIDKTSSMLMMFADPQQGDLGRLAFNRILPVEPSDFTAVLASFDGDIPALTRHSVGQGDVVWFLSSADASWGQWTTNPLYLPLVHQMAGDLLNLTGEGRIRFRSVGSDRELVSNRPPSIIRNVSLQTDGTTSSDPSAVNSLAFDHPGFESEDRGVLYVVNSASRESDTTRLPAEDFASHFQITVADSDSTEVAQPVQNESKRELWPLFAALTALLLATEFFLANRTTA
ncbi:BatA domain-containing protein [Stieleria sp. JC731]|uniref:BatA domain-containing protein n=1 Tax=Pirellulaceae TaxID=2691357 RepID=UPI001E5B6C33|nr:BatA domain-containing protein [Stieleria sp. JC731]MCC9604017.1 BatA domain-containing protein [Stieleria sp. JC731]